MFLEQLESRTHLASNVVLEWNIVDGFTYMTQGMAASWSNQTAGGTPDVNNLVSGNKDFVLEILGLPAHTQLKATMGSYAIIAEDSPGDTDMMEHTIVTNGTLNGQETYEMLTQWDFDDTAVLHDAATTTIGWTSFTFENSDRWAPGNLQILIATPEVAIHAPDAYAMEGGAGGRFEIEVIDNYVAFQVGIDVQFVSGSEYYASAEDILDLGDDNIIINPFQSVYQLNWSAYDDTLDEVVGETFNVRIFASTQYRIISGYDSVIGNVIDNEF